MFHVRSISCSWPEAVWENGQFLLCFRYLHCPKWFIRGGAEDGPGVKIVHKRGRRTQLLFMFLDRGPFLSLKDYAVFFVYF
jgi:hypothetical protein